MVTAAPHVDADTRAEPYDPLDMLVAGEPVAELDDALRCMGRQLRQARGREDGDASTRLRRWIDGRLDERTTFRTDPSASRRTGNDRELPGCPPTPLPRGRGER